MTRIVILGGGYAGAEAASRLGRRGIPVTLVDAGAGLVERVRLHQIAAGDDIWPVPFKRLFGDAPVTVVRDRVVAIDRRARRVRTESGEIAYDRLVYALGSTVDLDSVSGVREHALSLSGPAAAGRIRERLGTSKRAIVVGGGLSGVEIAAEIAERWPSLEVAIVAAGKIGPRLSASADLYLRETLTSRGVRLHDDTIVTEVRRDGVVANGEMLHADAVIWCGGMRVSSIAREAGLQTNEIGQILVGDDLRTSDPDIYAIGDAARFRNLGMQCATALPMGAYVADALAGIADGPFRFAYAVTCISLGRNDGIIQMKNPDDTPRERFLSGRPAAWVKELICRYAVMSVRMERAGLRYRWPKPIAA
ncbi:MAG TPA: FAD-dependent oxidoreductase [Thermoanaerobaculia bacterium]